MRYFTFVLLLAFSFVNAQDFHIRYNQAGYTPNRPATLVIMSKVDLKDKTWQLTGANTREGKIDKSFTGKGIHTPFAYNYKIALDTLKTLGENTFTFQGQKVQFSVSENPYAPFALEVMQYLRQQRSGSKYAKDHGMCHEIDSSVSIYERKDGQNNNWVPSKNTAKVNVMGGWHDAGDYLKFNLTASYTTYLLLRSYENNPALFQAKKFSKTKYNDLLDEAKVGLDFMEKCYVNDSTFVIQVGDERDHNQPEGNRLPHLDTNSFRQAHIALSRPHLAYNSAAFALASSIYKEFDAELAKKYEDLAKRLFDLAVKNKKPAWYTKGHETFYQDKTGMDNLLLATVELYKLTNDKKYKEDISYYADGAGNGYWASWGDFNMFAQHRAAPYNIRSVNYVKADMNIFTGHYEHANNIFGVPHEYTWGSLYSMIAVGSISKLYGELKKTNEFDCMKWDVVDYIFGRNNWGIAMIASKKLPNTIKHPYSQVYKLQPKLFPTGALAEGPGDYKSHLEMEKYYSMNVETVMKFQPFNTSTVIFFDDPTNFQTMETTIGGLADGIFFLSLLNK